MAARAPPTENAGGYDYKFVKPPLDSLLCTICFSPSKEPYLTACCGNTFCKSCLEGSKKFSNICPVCRSEEFTAMFNKQSDRMIRSLHIFCTNKEQGCEWQGEVNDITGHLGNCLFQLVLCLNECAERLQRQHLTSHVEIECPRRTVSCQYCNDAGEYQFIEGQHKEECPKFPVQCPNECEIESLHRDEVEEHREVCPLEMIQCDYHVVGCKVKMARKDRNSHKQEMMEVHLSLSINELMETKMQLKSAQNNLKHDVEKTKDDLTQQLVWHTTKIADTEQQLLTSQQETKKTKDQLTQRIVLAENQFTSTNHKLTTVEKAANMQLENLQQQLSASQLEVKKITAKMTASQQEATRTKDQLLQKLTATEKELNTTKQLSASQLEVNKITEDLIAKLTASQQEAKRTKDQLLQKLTATEKELNTTKQQLATTCQNLTKAEKEHTTLAASTDKALTEMKGMITEAVTASEKKVAEALRQKAQVIEEMCNPWFISVQYRASKLSSGDQFVPVVVKITEFTKHMESGWVSTPFHFYHGNKGQHKLQLKVASRKSDQTTYISISLSSNIMTVLTPLYQPVTRFTVKLLNQISDSEHIEDNQVALRGSSVNKDHRNTKFISYEGLQRNTVTCQYFRNDTVFFEVLQI